MVGFVGAHPPPACDAEADYGQKDGENDDEVNVAQHASVLCGWLWQRKRLVQYYFYCGVSKTDLIRQWKFSSPEKPLNFRKSHLFHTYSQRIF